MKGKEEDDSETGIGMQVRMFNKDKCVCRTVASYPGPFLHGEEKGPGTHYMHMHWHNKCISIETCHGTAHMHILKYKRIRIYDNIRFPQIFLMSLGACVCNVYQALFSSPLKKGPGYKSRLGMQLRLFNKYKRLSRTDVIT